MSKSNAFGIDNYIKIMIEDNVKIEQIGKGQLHLDYDREQC